MLIEARTLINCKAQNLDGDLSKIKDIYFDNSNWKIHNLILYMSRWLKTDDKFLISPGDIEGMDSTNSVIFTSVTSQQMKQNPGNKLALEASVKKDSEKQKPHKQLKIDNKAGHRQKQKKSHNIINLFSTMGLFGYHVHSFDEEIGLLKDLTADTGNWIFKHLIISDKHSYKNSKLMVPTSSVREISIKKRQITVDLSSDNIKSPDDIEAASQLFRD